MATQLFFSDFEPTLQAHKVNQTALSLRNVEMLWTLTKNGGWVSGAVQ